LKRGRGGGLAPRNLPPGGARKGKGKRNSIGVGGDLFRKGKRGGGKIFRQRRTERKKSKGERKENRTSAEGAPLAWFLLLGGKRGIRGGRRRAGRTLGLAGQKKKKGGGGLESKASVFYVARGRATVKQKRKKREP